MSKTVEVFADLMRNPSTPALIHCQAQYITRLLTTAGGTNNVCTTLQLWDENGEYMCGHCLQSVYDTCVLALSTVRPVKKSRALPKNRRRL